MKKKLSIEQIKELQKSGVAVIDSDGSKFKPFVERYNAKQLKKAEAPEAKPVDPIQVLVEEVKKLSSDSSFQLSSSLVVMDRAIKELKAMQERPIEVIVQSPEIISKKWLFKIKRGYGNLIEEIEAQQID
jgi:hypothetical protein